MDQLAFKPNDGSVEQLDDSEYDGSIYSNAIDRNIPKFDCDQSVADSVSVRQMQEQQSEVASSHMSSVMKRDSLTEDYSIVQKREVKESKNNLIKIRSRDEFGEDGFVFIDKDDFMDEMRQSKKAFLQKQQNFSLPFVEQLDHDR